MSALVFLQKAISQAKRALGPSKKAPKRRNDFLLIHHNYSLNFKINHSCFQNSKVLQQDPVKVRFLILLGADFDS
jgi:hypothetical protein